MTATSSRSALGPTGGPNVVNRLTIDTAQPHDTADILDLFERVLSATPTYLPGVTAGAVSLDHWYRRKDPQRVRIARTPASGSRIIGHAAVRLNGMRPDGPLLADRLSWELSMLVVAPGLRGCGIASRLIEDATHAFTIPLWASVHQHEPGHHLLVSNGWEAIDGFYWPNDPNPGLIMLSPTP
jgi:GNAT superfamily N-acetyltransferase